MYKYSNNWNLRQELYNLLHQWPTIIASFAIGCLIGWLFTFILPVSYRSTVQIHVGLNPYRAYEDTTFLAIARPKYSNVDDYKHWQMSQLNSVIYLDEFISETLEILQSNDNADYWKTINASQLLSTLDSDWRSAGTWSLTASHPNTIHAEQAAQTWSEVVVKNVKTAVQSARDTFMIDQQLDKISSDLVQSEIRLEHLIITKENLQAWVKSAERLPQDHLLDPSERWQILSQVTQVALFTPGWEMILEQQPAEDANTSSYLDWIDQVIVYIDVEVPLLQQQILSLEKKHESLAEEYAIASDTSLGLSPNIAIEGKGTITTEVLRPVSLLTLIGGILGLCAWLFYQLVRIARQESHSPAFDRENSLE